MDLFDDQYDDVVNPPPHRFNYKGVSPWKAPPAVEADDTVFHADSMTTPPKVHHFLGTINLGFAVTEATHSETNVAILL
jgi:hypothetical protein